MRPAVVAEGELRVEDDARLEEDAEQSLMPTPRLGARSKCCRPVVYETIVSSGRQDRAEHRTGISQQRKLKADL